ncbi:ABC transporter ATP-binding protein [Kocuria rhizophila]|uniref:ABC transporter ATP-binding protein n=1 Tax=Kocuria rhizophila TaxID=72000 RepID=UPI0021A5ECC9|nr:ABC transporter ATP-binding protein [Kocuria rhizophila]MCT1915870.1 ABC transporter ATP-binding protein/permease [Kocuria rhizophila]MDN3225771.1 ABC transporter ATP-binding protein [Kocuria rhizophila]
MMLGIAVLTAALDLVSVASLLPLTQLLTGDGELPGAVQRFVVPVVHTTDRQQLLLWTAALIGALFLAKNVVMLASRYWSVGVTRRAEAAAQRSLLDRYVHTDYESHRLRNQSATINMIMGGLPQAFSAVLGGYISWGVDLVTVIALAGSLLVLSPLAASAAVVIFGGFAVFVSRIVKPISISRAHRAYERDREVFNYLNPAIQGFREMRLYSQEELFLDAFGKNRQELAELNRFQQVVMEVPRYLLEFVLIVGIMVVAVILFLTQDQTTAFGLLAVFAAASMRIIPCLNRMVATRSQIHAGSPGTAELADEILRLDSEVANYRHYDKDPPHQLQQLPIDVVGVGFSYRDAARSVLKNVNIRIWPGSTVALVGPSGAGKSTFADLLAGLLRPTEGALLMGGAGLTSHYSAWRRQVAMVSQNPYMWTATLRELITFEREEEECDLALLRAAIRQAALEDVADRLPSGLDTVIGDGGARLSGGETQRVALARALYRHPAVLILDEATSAMDNETESLITRALDELHGQLTIVLIAHRMSTVRNADDILYFRGGTLETHGTFDELRASHPGFAHLVDLGSLSP